MVGTVRHESFATEETRVQAGGHQAKGDGPRCPAAAAAVGGGQAEGQTPVRGRRGRVVNIRGPKKGGTGDARLARYYGVSADRLIRHLADDIPAA